MSKTHQPSLLFSSALRRVIAAKGSSPSVWAGFSAARHSDILINCQDKIVKAQNNHTAPDCRTQSM
ncbi:hypothetical protein EYF80_027304 [Liparis tanakae]|uniref:Uncharacterized protein n=1 Tax=Liparis tanakae TaxID=230148 RepID=A0A4Z2HA64_9TELE|nr:hypothetical protein EYF80_027304 [Liparis tanakae]